MSGKLAVPVTSTVIKAYPRGIQFRTGVVPSVSMERSSATSSAEPLLVTCIIAKKASKVHKKFKNIARKMLHQSLEEARKTSKSSTLRWTVCLSSFLQETQSRPQKQLSGRIVIHRMMAHSRTFLWMPCNLFKRTLQATLSPVTLLASYQRSKQLIT